MYIIRPIELHDEQSFLELALSSGPGIITLPRDPLRIKQILADSLEAFSSKDSFADKRYIFVLENLETKHIEGCSSILKSINQDAHYKEELQYSTHRTIEQIPPVQKILNPQISGNHISEISTLFLSRINRKAGLGRLLSLSRFLFVACHRERFEKEFMAEMRGVIDPSGRAPFWEGVGRHFCDLNFETISALLEANPEFAKEIIPKNPIYCALLPQDTQDAIGKTHPDTIPALRMLENQGFRYCGWIDIIDGGPRIRATTSEIQVIKTATHARVANITKNNMTEISPDLKLISNKKLNFRACYGMVIMNDHGATIDESTARKLEVEKGEMICFNDIIHHSSGKNR